MTNNATEEVYELAHYLFGYAAATDDDKLASAAKWMEKLSRYVCGQGYIRCSGGPNCDSDHK